MTFHGAKTSGHVYSSRDYAHVVTKLDPLDRVSSSDKLCRWLGISHLDLARNAIIILYQPSFVDLVGVSRFSFLVVPVYYGRVLGKLMKLNKCDNTKHDGPNHVEESLRRKPLRSREVFLEMTFRLSPTLS